MADFVRKTMMGYSPVRGGYSDPECTHVILTKEEYDQILREKVQAEQSARDVNYKADKEISEVKRTADYNVRQCADDARRAIEGMETALDTEKAKTEHQRRLNEGLLRIVRERANADRKLKPKKEHTGYVILASSEREYYYKDRNRDRRKELFWETILQSPYSVSFSASEIKPQILEDLRQEDEDGEWMISRIGIRGMYGLGYEALLDDTRWSEEDKLLNIMLEQKLKRNFRSGYWEISFIHTKPLDEIPPEMLLECGQRE